MVHVLSPDFAIVAVQFVVVVRDIVTVTGQEELIMDQLSLPRQEIVTGPKAACRRQPARRSKWDIVVGRSHGRRAALAGRL